MLLIFLFTNNSVLIHMSVFNLIHKKVLCSNHPLMILMIILKHTLIILQQTDLCRTFYGVLKFYALRPPLTTTRNSFPTHKPGVWNVSEANVAAGINK